MHQTGFAASVGGKVDMSKYSCPLYMYPNRMTGALGTYIDQIDLVIPFPSSARAVAVQVGADDGGVI